MKSNNKNFNLAAKIILGISMFMLVVDAILCFHHADLYSSLNAGINYSHYIIKAFLNLIMAVVAFWIFYGKRWALITFIMLGIVRIFATIPVGVETSVAYLIGQNTTYFIRDVGLFAIAMCFRKNHISGWRAFFANDSSTEAIEQDYKATSKKAKIYKYILTSALSIVAILVIIINFTKYPDFVNTFTDKASVFFGIPNNKLASICLQKSKDSYELGLSGKVDYYIDLCKKLKPSNVETISGIADYYDKQEDYDSALKWYKKGLRAMPDNEYLKNSVAHCLYKTDIDEAVSYAEAMIEDNPSNGIAACILRDYYYQKEEYDPAFYWGLRAFHNKPNQEKSDLDVFSRVLSKKICKTGYQNKEISLIVSCNIDEQPVYGMTLHEFAEREQQLRKTGHLTLCLRNKGDLPPKEGFYYFIHLLDYEAGDIWPYDRLLRNIDALTKDHPDVIICSLSIIE